jgi:hypothetical protein
VVATEGAGFLLGDPAYDGLMSVADVTTELNVWDAAAPGVFAHPADRDAEQLGDVDSGEETVAHIQTRETY